MGWVQAGQVQVGEHLAVGHQVGDAAHVAVAFAGHGGVVQQLLGNHFAQKLMLGQVLHHQIVVGQLVGLAHAVDQNHLVEGFVGGRVADDAHERGQAGAGRQQIQAFAGQQVVNQQGAGGLFADDDAVADLDVLQARRQRAFGHLDAQKLQVLFVIGADDAVGPQQRFVVHAQANHGEVAVGKPQRRVAGGGEGKQAVGPVVHGQNSFFVESAHVIRQCWVA